MFAGLRPCALVTQHGRCQTAQRTEVLQRRGYQAPRRCARRLDNQSRVLRQSEHVAGYKLGRRRTPRTLRMQSVAIAAKMYFPRRPSPIPNGMTILGFMSAKSSSYPPSDQLLDLNFLSKNVGLRSDQGPTVYIDGKQQRNKQQPGAYAQ